MRDARARRHQRDHVQARILTITQVQERQELPSGRAAPSLQPALDGSPQWSLRGPQGSTRRARVSMTRATSAGAFRLARWSRRASVTRSAWGMTGGRPGAAGLAGVPGRPGRTRPGLPARAWCRRAARDAGNQGHPVIGGDDMATLTTPARPEENLSPRPLQWRRMARVTWRQHRAALGGVAALLGVLTLWLWVTGLQVHHSYTAGGRWGGDTSSSWTSGARWPGSRPPRSSGDTAAAHRAAGSSPCRYRRARSPRQR
jgi:hypothetical protein